MKGTVGRLARLLAGNLVKILSLLLAVSLIAFVLVTASPVDPVQQYILPFSLIYCLPPAIEKMIPSERMYIFFSR